MAVMHFYLLAIVWILKRENFCNNQLKKKSQQANFSQHKVLNQRNNIRALSSERLNHCASLYWRNTVSQKNAFHNPNRPKNRALIQTTLIVMS